MDSRIITLETIIPEYMVTLGDSPRESALHARMHQFLTNDLHILRRPKYREHPDEYCPSVRVLVGLRDCLKADVTNITHPTVQTILNTISALIAHYTDEADIARDRRHEHMADAKESEMEYEDDEE